MRIVIAIFIVSFVCAAGLGGNGTRVDAPRSKPPFVPSFESASCGFKEEGDDWPVKNGVSCGWVTVKAHHENADGPMLRLWVVKVAAKGLKGTASTPLIRLWYGPMAANITPSVLKTAEFTELVRATRDVIFFDYRGMGRSEPSTKCTVAPAVGVTVETRLSSILAQSKECRRQIETAGTDLSALNAAAASQDVRDIAQALGYSTYDIWGASYGSFPALDLIGQHPAGLRAAIIGVAIPPDSHNREQISTFAKGLAVMQRECDRDVQCHVRFPNMATSLGRAMERLDRERLMGRSRRLTPLDLYNSLLGMAAFADDNSLSYVPLAVETAMKGDTALVERWIDATKGDDFGFPDMSSPDAAAMVTLNCSSFLGSQPTKADYELAGRRYPYLARAIRPTDAFDRICEIWKIPSPARNVWQPVTSEIPVLFYSARLDTAVTNSDTVRAAKLLPHSIIIDVPGVGHTFTDRCLVRLEAAFLVNPSGVLDRSCTADMRPIKFAFDGFETYVATVAGR